MELLLALTYSSECVVAISGSPYDNSATTFFLASSRISRPSSTTHLLTAIISIASSSINARMFVRSLSEISLVNLSIHIFLQTFQYIYRTDAKALVSINSQSNKPKHNNDMKELELNLV